MKKFNSILLILAVAAGFTNCSKADLVENKEAENGGAVVYAITDAVTKTTLSNDYKVLWSTGDKIKFVNTETPATTYTFTLSEGAGTTSGTFTGDIPADGEYTVYYPAAYDGTNWPAQTYVSATDISGAPMKATAIVSGGEVSDISFKNEGGILRYTVKGSKTIKSINVKSGSTLDVTLDCGTSGVALTAEGTVFNIALPASEYSNATLTFTATDNTVATKTASTFKVTKNVVSLATFEASALSFVAPPAPDGFVDLGVADANGKPLYWAECNLGASKAEDYGDYFAWGQTTGYKPTGSTFAHSFSWKSYCGSDKFVEWSTPPYDATSKILLPAYDAATTVNSSWRTPTKDEFTTLKNNCYWEWTDNYKGSSVKGVIVYKAKNGVDKGKYGGQTGYTTSDTHIFFPAAGDGKGTELVNASTIGFYWLSTFKSTNTAEGVSTSYDLRFENKEVRAEDGSSRYYGFPVRPVTTEAAAPAPAPEYVTIGGVKWATKNLGATTVAGSLATCVGDYFQWGSVNTLYNEIPWNTLDNEGNISITSWQEGKSSGFVAENREYLELADLPDSYDVVKQTIGNGWRMPSRTDFMNLYNACGGVEKPKSGWSTSTTEKGVYWCDAYDGVAGILFFDGANKLFFPASGFGDETGIKFAGTYGYCWSSTYFDESDAYYLNFDSNVVCPDSYDCRYFGFPIRPVSTEGVGPAPAATTGTAKATIGGSEVEVNWVQLWENGPKFAEYNVGVTSTSPTGTMMTYIDATKADAEYVWGANWCTPSKEDMDHLMTAAAGETDEKVKCEYTQEGGQWGFKFTGKETGYTGNSVFFPARDGDSHDGHARYWSATANGSEAWYVYLGFGDDDWRSYWESDYQNSEYLVRPVFKN